MPRAFLFILLFYMGAVNAQKNSSGVEAQFQSLKWLEGAWERTNVKPGIRANEEWHVTSSGELKGIGVTMKEADTVFVERIQILIKDKHIYYVADVKENKAPVYFKVTSLTPDGFICENPNHDFPKRIEYRVAGSTLTVIISAGNKSQNYLFTRL